MDCIDRASDRSSLWHEVASDVCVLIEHSSHDTHWWEEPKAFLDAVLEVNKMLHVIAVCGGMEMVRERERERERKKEKYLVISSPSSFSLKMASTS